MSADMTALPKRHVAVRHAMAVCVGTVIGSGIFRASPNVAANLGSFEWLTLVWVAGAALSFVGALCFAEMAAAFPSAGGDYAFLSMAYGQRVARLFAWSRFAVIHTGSMALLAFVFGDYLAQWFDLGNQASAAFGATAVVALIAINMRGVHPGLRTQLGLMGVVVFGLACVGLAGVWYALSGAAPLNPQPAMARTEWRHIGNAMIFVLLAYGGWSDAATLSAEMRDEKRGIVWALLGGLLIVAVLYLGANWAYVRILGLGGLAASQAPAAEAMRQALGRTGEILVVATVAVSAISVMNALLMVGARTTYAAMRDWRGHVHLGHWDEQRGTPVKAMLAMGAVALCQIGLGSLAPHGFSAMVDYLTPVYWFFLSLSATAVMVMRYRYPEVPRPFKTPWFPFAPLLFLASSLYMLYASLVFVRAGALMGLAVLGLGAVLFWREPGKTAP